MVGGAGTGSCGSDAGELGTGGRKPSTGEVSGSFVSCLGLGFRAISEPHSLHLPPMNLQDHPRIPNP